MCRIMRGPNRQDYGEYDDVHRLVYDKLKAAGIGLSGVTIDNPYDYLIGEHISVNLKDPTSVNWIKRVSDYEDRCRAEGLDVNLIVNSERGGQQSDELFCRETQQMVDTYLKAGGRPTALVRAKLVPASQADRARDGALLNDCPGQGGDPGSAARFRGKRRDIPA